MNHVHEGALQALLDDQMGADERTTVERHLVGCRDCVASLSELRAASGALDAALALLDRPAPLDAAERALRGRRAAERVASTRRALLRAAVLVLAFAAVASAALPGSPLRAWAVAAWRQSAAFLAGEAAGPVGTSAPDESEAGISLRPPDGRARVVVEAPAPGVRARVRLVEGDRVSVRAFGGAASARFRTGPNRIDVVEPGPGELTVDVPATMRSAELVVDGRTVVSKDGAYLRVADGFAPGAAGRATEVVVDLTRPGSNR